MHRLLERQLRRQLKSDAPIPPEWQGLLDAVGAAYEQFDADHAMIERSLELNNKELLERNRELQAADRIKSQFLANMSHEIRTPMAAILGFADLLLDPHQDFEQRTDCVQTIRRNGEHLLSVISDILDLSKIVAGHLSVERIECHLQQIIDEAVKLMSVRAAAKNLTLEVEQSPDLPTALQSDPTRLKQILINLLGNAIKFTERGGVRMKVCMSQTAETGRRLCVEVIDTGIGITDEQVQKLFQPFTQADASMSRRFGGTGLGLAISKRLAEALGGDLTVQSQSGAGSTFTLTIDPGNVPLPACGLAAPAAAAPVVTEPALAPKPLGPLSGLRILVAEDGPDNQRLILFHLRKAGAETTLVDNGLKARDTALAERDSGKPFDIILMDMQMPEMDGYQATTQLRDRGYTLPIVALTAHVMTGDREKCLNVGCDDFVGKPVDQAKLRAVILQYTSAQSRREEQLVA